MLLTKSPPPVKINLLTFHNLLLSFYSTLSFSNVAHLLFIRLVLIHLSNTSKLRLLPDSDGNNEHRIRMKEVSRKLGGSTPCAACKLLRRRCSQDCVFAPYFPADEPHKFASVHKVFGASNVSKMLQELPEEHRRDAVSSMVYEANARMRDPVYGCVGAISYLQQQIDGLTKQLAEAQAEVVHLKLRQTVSSPAISGSPSFYNLFSHSTPSYDMDTVVQEATFRQSMWSSS